MGEFSKRIISLRRHWRACVCRCVTVGVTIWAMCGGALATAPVFSAILGGAGQDYAASVAADLQGNTYVAGLTYSPDFRVTTGAFQTKAGGGSDAFVAKFSASGVLLWSTYLGGNGDDWATGVAVDSGGNVLVTGWTRSVDFPVVHALQGTLNNGASPARYDAFIAKLNPAGTRLLYSTFLGGSDDDGANALALDAAGNAYIAGNSNSSAGFTGVKVTADTFGAFVAKVDPSGALLYAFFHPYENTAAAIAVDRTGSAYVAGTMSTSNPATSVTKAFGPNGAFVALVSKLSPDGSRLLYESSLGGSIRADAAAVAVDSTGAAYVAGSTTSTDFPLVQPLQSTLGARPLWKSVDRGVTWQPLDGLPFAYLQSLVVDPSAPDKLYATAPEGGVFRSADGGVTWSKAASGIENPNLRALAIDPVHPQNLYAGAYGGAPAVYRSANGGDTWTTADSQPARVMQLAVDPQRPSDVYAVWENSVARKSGDSGATWNSLAFRGNFIASLAIDPRVAGSIFAHSVEDPGFHSTTGAPPQLWDSADAGANWTLVPGVSPTQPGPFVDATTNPSTIYAGMLTRSVDGGQTWGLTPPSPVATRDTTAFAADPAGTLYAAVYQRGVYTSHDHGATWTPVGTPLLGATGFGAANSISAIVPAGATGTLYAIVGNTQTSGFVTKLSPDGASIVFSTLFNSHVSPTPFLTLAAQPTVFLSQNWISGIALDAAGNVVVAGGTRGNDLPTVNAVQPSTAGGSDAFTATVAADGSRLIASTYFGGSQDDGALAVTTDAQGNVILAGQALSLDFPVPGGVQAPAGLGEAFVVKLAPFAPPAITAVENAASFQPGIAPGSWVMIRGTNLANTNPGRSWRAPEIVNGALPTSLDGVSVTIDGKPAFVSYISATQINVQAPSDASTGAVNVVVRNNGSDSAAFAAQLQAAAPALFQYPNTSFALASRLPDYALTGDPAAIPGTVAAKGDDVVVLWGTGFGATMPPAPAGAAVVGAPAVAAPITVMVGGMPVEVRNAVLTAGSAGLYQITIQLPAGIPSGAAEVRATASGAQSPAGVRMFIAP